MHVGRRGSIFILFIVLGIFYLVFSLVAFAAIAAPTTEGIYLEPGRQLLIELPSNLKTAKIVFPGDIYIMDSLPSIVGTSTITDTATDTIASDSYSYWLFSVTTGTVVTISWSASRSVAVYLLEGQSEFSRWEDGDTPVGSLISSQSSGSYTYTASRNIDLYIAFENPGFGLLPVDLSRTITIEEPKYDTSQGTKYTGQVEVELDSTKYAVLHNNQNVDLQGKITKEKDFGVGEFQIVWGIITLALIVLAVFILYKAGDDKPHMTTTAQNNTVTTPTSQVAVQQSSWVASPQTPQQSSWAAPMTRPSPQYCPSCSTPVLASDKFCGSCGINLSKT